MADVPAEIKRNDLVRFVDKATELEEFQPIVSYWCYYHVVQKILQQNLHKQSPTCADYAVKLMDTLELLKARLSDREEIRDETEAKRYMTDFADAVLDRANLQIQSNTVTQRTVHALRAAYTFYDLLSIWTAQPADEVAAKVKFAKYHAVRILKAIQAGQDPNLTNPSPPGQTGAAISDMPEAAELDAGSVAVDRESRDGAVPPGRFQPYVEDQTDALADRLQAATTRASSSASAPTLAKAPPPAPPAHPSAPQAGLTANPPAVRPASAAPLPSRPAVQAGHPGRSTPVARVPQLEDFLDDDTVDLDDSPVAHPRTTRPKRRTDEDGLDPEIIARAQKHSKWAVSALDFSDTTTAVKELKNALRLLQSI